MFERQDWELFRNLDGLSAKAGVPRDKIALLVAEELMDNALDESESYDMGLLDDNEGFFVQDNGPGIDPAQASSLFSIKRPLKSTKLFRPPSRGALGNGLRVAPHATLILHISYVTGILFIAGKDWCRRRRFLPDYLLD